MYFFLKDGITTVTRGWDMGVSALSLGLVVGVSSLLLEPGAALCPGWSTKG